VGTLVRQRRWWGFAVLVLALAALFVRLGFWQLHRLSERRARNAPIVANAHTPPAPLSAVLPPATGVSTLTQWRRVVVTGRWDAAGQVLVRNEPSNPNPGFGFFSSSSNGDWVATPLVPAQGPALLVVRGWVSTDSPGALTPPAPQPGRVTVTAYLLPAQNTAQPADLPAGQVNGVDTAAVAASTGLVLVDGYGQLAAEAPAPPDPVQLLPGPVASDGPHLIYAIQWFLLALTALAAFAAFSAREARGGPAEVLGRARPAARPGSAEAPASAAAAPVPAVRVRRGGLPPPAAERADTARR